MSCLLLKPYLQNREKWINMIKNNCLVAFSVEFIWHPKYLENEKKDKLEMMATFQSSVRYL